jgi:aspartate/methionine/tyrosine aminotransferase
MVSTAASQELMVPCVLALRLLLPWCHMQPLIQPGVQLVVANFPHNPTGTVLQQQDWKQLVSACQAAGAWLFSDEMYRFSGRHAPVLQGPGGAGPQNHCTCSQCGHVLCVLQTVWASAAVGSAQLWQWFSS